MLYPEHSPERYQATQTPLLQDLANNIRSLTTIPEFLLERISGSPSQEAYVDVICDDMDVVARKIRRYLDYVMSGNVPAKTIGDIEGKVSLLEKGVSLWTRTVRKGALDRNVTRTDVGLGRALVGVVEGLVGCLEIGPDAMRDKRYTDGYAYVWDKIQNEDMKQEPPRMKDIRLNMTGGDVMRQRWRLARNNRHWLQCIDFHDLPSLASSMRNVPLPELESYSFIDRRSHPYGSHEIPTLLYTRIDSMDFRICLPNNSPAILQMIDVDSTGLRTHSELLPLSHVKICRDTRNPHTVLRLVHDDKDMLTIARIPIKTWEFGVLLQSALLSLKCESDASGQVAEAIRKTEFDSAWEKSIAMAHIWQGKVMRGLVISEQVRPGGNPGRGRRISVVVLGDQFQRMILWTAFLDNQFHSSRKGFQQLDATRFIIKDIDMLTLSSGQDTDTGYDPRTRDVTFELTDEDQMEGFLEVLQEPSNPEYRKGYRYEPPQATVDTLGKRRVTIAK